jgi:hypothetical protein
VALWRRQVAANESGGINTAATAASIASASKYQ